LGCTASTENALIQSIEFLTFLLGLSPFDCGRCSVIDQPGLDAFILLEEQGLVDNEITDYRHAG